MQSNGGNLKLIKGRYHNLINLHDKVLTSLDTGEKKGIRELLRKNNESCKKLIFPYIKCAENHATVMTALTAILDAHSRECYAIGYLDSAVNDKEEIKGKTL